MMLLFLPVRALAQEADGILMEETQRLLEEMDLSSIQEQAPELDVQSILRSAAQGGGEVDGEALWQAVRGMALGSVRELVPRMLRIVGVSVLCAGLLQATATCSPVTCRAAADASAPPILPAPIKPASYFIMVLPPQRICPSPRIIYL